MLPPHIPNRYFIACTAGLIWISLAFWAPSPSAKSAGDGTAVRPTVTPSPSVEETINLSLKPVPTGYPEELKIDDIVDLSYGTRDIDCDGVQNREDNCPIAYNPDQRNEDKDEEGDVCDLDSGGDPAKPDWRCDTDGDGRLDRDDNCILVCNPKQQDRDKDGVGDACDVKLRPKFNRINPCPRRAKTDDLNFDGY